MNVFTLDYTVLLLAFVVAAYNVFRVCDGDYDNDDCKKSDTEKEKDVRGET